jgi:hypothetical protein
LIGIGGRVRRNGRSNSPIVRFEPASVGKQPKGMLPMNVSAVPATVVVKAPEVPVFKAPDKTPDVQNGAPADGTRKPQPTLVAPLPPGQGTRVDQLA